MTVKRLGTPSRFITNLRTPGAIPRALVAPASTVSEDSTYRTRWEAELALEELVEERGPFSGHLDAR